MKNDGNRSNRGASMWVASAKATPVITSSYSENNLRKIWSFDDSQSRGFEKFLIEAKRRMERRYSPGAWQRLNGRRNSVADLYEVARLGSVVCYG